MSQFMICKTKCDISKYGGKLLSSFDIGGSLFLSVLNRYFAIEEHCDIWLIEDIHDYFNKVIDSQSFAKSELYFMLDSLYDLCDCMILWYGGDYDNLEEVYSKEEFLKCIKDCIKNPCCEVYLKMYK